MPVETAVAKQDTVIDAISATGRVEPLQQIELRTEAEGRLVEILVREGSEVAQGQPLFRIDDQRLKAEVARAEADRDSRTSPWPGPSSSPGRTHHPRPIWNAPRQRLRMSQATRSAESPPRAHHGAALSAESRAAVCQSGRLS
jgi:multidrug efflux pump subunit AcrA (membrane-fusion protein)